MIRILLGSIVAPAKCGLLLQTEWRGLSVCLSVCHDREPCKSGRTDRHAVWDADSGASKERCICWGCRQRRIKELSEVGR